MSEPLKASVGRTVLVVLPQSIPGLRPAAVGQIRPATVVRTWGENGGPSSTVNVIVHLDGANDRHSEAPNQSWLTSVPYRADKIVGSWHFPDRI